MDITTTTKTVTTATVTFTEGEIALVRKWAARQLTQGDEEFHALALQFLNNLPAPEETPEPLGDLDIKATVVGFTMYGDLAHGDVVQVTGTTGEGYFEVARVSDGMWDVAYKVKFLPAASS